MLENLKDKRTTVPGIVLIIITIGSLLGVDLNPFAAAITAIIGVGGGLLGLFSKG